MISKKQAEAKANQIVKTLGKGTRVGSSKDVCGGWIFYPEPRAEIEGSGAYWPPVIIVNADNGQAHRTDGCSPLERELRLFGMSTGRV